MEQDRPVGLSIPVLRGAPVADLHGQKSIETTVSHTASQGADRAVPFDDESLVDAVVASPDLHGIAAIGRNGPVGNIPTETTIDRLRVDAGNLAVVAAERAPGDVASEIAAVVGPFAQKKSPEPP